jgi:hypothetical protein
MMVNAIDSIIIIQAMVNLMLNSEIMIDDNFIFI